MTLGVIEYDYNSSKENIETKTQGAEPSASHRNVSVES